MRRNMSRDLVPIKQAQAQAQTTSQGSTSNPEGRPLGIVPPPHAAIANAKATANGDVLKNTKEDDKKTLDDAERLAAVAQSTNAIAEQYLKAMEKGQNLSDKP